jgi:hypothetical protein
MDRPLLGQLLLDELIIIEVVVRTVSRGNSRLPDVGFLRPPGFIVGAAFTARSSSDSNIGSAVRADERLSSSAAFHELGLEISG